MAATETTPNEANDNENEDENAVAEVVIIPTTIFLDHILPFLDRRSWNRLCSTYQELYTEANSEHARLHPAPWPCTRLKIKHQVHIPPTSLVFSPDSTMLACSNSGYLQVWEQRHGLYRKYPTYIGNLQALSFSPDSHLLAFQDSSRRGGSVCLWNLKQDTYFWLDRPTMNMLGENYIKINALCFSEDGQEVLGASEFHVYTWRIRDGAVVRSLRPGRAFFMPRRPGAPPIIPNTQSLLLLRFRPDQEQLAAGHDNGTINLWNFMEQLELGGGEEQELDLFFRHHFIFHQQQQPPPPPRHTIRIHQAHQGKVHDINYSPCGNFLASAGDDFLVKLWNVSDGSIRSIFRGHKRAVNSVSFSINGKL
jgi:WD40 repeat protein